MSSDAVSHQLQQQLTRCRSPRRRSSIARRWAHTHEVLDGLTIDDIIDCCARGTIEQNPIVAALADLHQSGDTDATTVLLTVCEPIVFGIANYNHRSTKIPQGHTDGLWAALGHALATLDPANEPVDTDGRPRVLLAHIGSCVAQSRKKIDASDRRQRRRDACWQHDDHTSRFTTLSEHLGNETNAQRFATDHSAVEDAALHAIELGRIAQVVSDGTISAAKWESLVNHRISGRTNATSRERVAAHRTARQLSRLVDHAA